MDKLDIEIIKHSLKTKELGKKIYYFEEIDSTNVYAKKISKNNEHGSVIIAETQTNGRGRQGDNWESQYGTGIWMSVILRAAIHPKDIIKITSMVGLAVKKGIEKVVNEKVYIKWPNDIIINKKKVCGILVESIISGKNVECLVVGIGINVKQKKDYFKSLSHASSLEVECKATLKREDIISSVLYSLEEEYNIFLKNMKLDVNELKSSSILFNKKVKIVTKDMNKIGKVIDFLEDGSIIIQDEHNEKVNYKTCDVSIRGLNSYID